MTGNKTLKEAVRTRALSLGETVKVLKAACRTYYDQHGFPGGAESEELLELLVSGNLRFGSAECGDPAKDGTADAGEAERLAAALSRRSQLYMVRAALHVFAGYAYDLSCSRRGALYYPGLQLYACIGRQPPRTLLDLLSLPHCGRVAVFVPEYRTWKHSRCLFFERAENAGALAEAPALF